MVERANVLVILGGSEVTVVTSHSYGKGEGVGWGGVSVTNLTIVKGVVTLTTIIYFSGCSP